MTGRIVTNERGGKQSASPYFLRGLPPLALLRIGRVLKEGAEEYEADPFGDVTRRNWHRISSDEHLEHLMAHVVAYLHGDITEDHAGHIATRSLFFLRQYLVERPEQQP